MVQQVRSHLDDLVPAHTVVREFVVKAFRDYFQHLIALFLSSNFFVALLLHGYRRIISPSQLKSRRLADRKGSIRATRDERAVNRCLIAICPRAGVTSI